MIIMQELDVKKVLIRLDSVNIADFSIGNKSVRFSVYFNANGKRELHKSVALSDFSKAGDFILDSVLDSVNNAHLKFDGSELKSGISCKFVDREFYLSSLNLFFSSVKSKFTRVLSSNDSEEYMKMVSDFLKSGVRL